MIEITADRIRALTGGELLGDPSRPIREVAPLEAAHGQALSFVASRKYLPYLATSRAGVILIRREWAGSLAPGATAVLVADPHVALRRVLLEMFPAVEAEPGVHETAVVGAEVAIGDGVWVGPHAVIGDGVELGARCRIGAHAMVAAGCVIGADVTIASHATLYEGVVVGERSVIHSGARVGKEGFGFVWEEGGHRKIPQVGGCLIGADVEIGANVTIDRGSVGDTVIGAGSKIDNLVHVGHNVRIGRHVLILAQVGISGSTVIGDGVVLAGQVGVAGHVEVGAGARVGGQAGIISDVPAGATYSGYPARPHREALRAQAAMFRLPELLRRLLREADGKGRGPEGEAD